MTPQERQLINQLFDRLASLEAAPRDPDAEAMIREGMRRAPNAVYSLVQTVLVQDEALKAANAHIQEYEQANGVAQQPNEPPRGFLDSMRDSVFGRAEPRGSVPRVPQAGSPGYRPDPWGQGQGYQGAPMQQQAPMPPPQQGGGSSFLGTAAAAAAGLIGGSLLMGGIRSAMGGHTGGGPASGAFDSLTGNRGGSAAGSDLARDAGLGDIGGSRRAGLFDQAQTDQDADDDADADEADDVADGGSDDGDSDTA
jgi:hypothetical protein